MYWHFDVNLRYTIKPIILYRRRWWWLEAYRGSPYASGAVDHSPTRSLLRMNGQWKWKSFRRRSPSLATPLRLITSRSSTSCLPPLSLSLPLPLPTRTHLPFSSPPIRRWLRKMRLQAALKCAHTQPICCLTEQCLYRRKIIQQIYLYKNKLHGITPCRNILVVTG